MGWATKLKPFRKRNRGGVEARAVGVLDWQFGATEPTANGEILACRLLDRRAIGN